jgi:hypothetical protein
MGILVIYLIEITHRFVELQILVDRLTNWKTLPYHFCVEGCVLTFPDLKKNACHFLM